MIKKLLNNIYLYRKVVNINIKKSKFASFLNGGKALFIAAIAVQILAAVNIQQYSLRIQLIFSVLFFATLFIIINKSKVTSNDSEKKVSNFIIAFAATGVFIALIMSLIEEEYYTFWSLHKSVFVTLFFAFFCVGSCICFVLLIRYKKYNNKK